jgi:hypothetical protein
MTLTGQPGRTVSNPQFLPTGFKRHGKYFKTIQKMTENDVCLQIFFLSIFFICIFYNFHTNKMEVKILPKTLNGQP